MNVSELIEQLKKIDPDRRVVGYDEYDILSEEISIVLASVCPIDAVEKNDGERGCTPAIIFAVDEGKEYLK